MSHISIRHEPPAYFPPKTLGELTKHIENALRSLHEHLRLMQERDAGRQAEPTFSIKIEVHTSDGGRHGIKLQARTEVLNEVARLQVIE